MTLHRLSAVAVVLTLSAGALAQGKPQGSATPPPGVPGPVPPEPPQVPPADQQPAAGGQPPADLPTPPAASVQPTETEYRTSARVMYGSARVAYAAGRYAEALSLIDSAFNLHDAPTLLLARAYVLDRMERREEARAAYVSYLRRRPDDPERPAIQARLSTLSGVGPAPQPYSQTGMHPASAPGVQPLPAQPPPEPEKPKPPRTHDGPVFLRLSAFWGKLAGSDEAYDDGYSTGSRAYESSFYGVGFAVGGVATPGVAIAFEGQLFSSDLSYTDTYSYEGGGGERTEEGDEAGPGVAASAEIHGFTNSKGGFHILGGAGYVAFGDDDLDKVAGPRFHFGLGWSFWLKDQSSIDPVLRVEFMPEGDRVGAFAFASLNVGFVWD